MNCSLKLDCMKEKLLVIVNQNVTVNTFLDLTHIARHTTKENYF